MNPGQTAPRKKTFGLRQRAWWVMRRHRVFTLPELLSTVADGAERDAENNLGRWLRALTRAGILKIEGRAKPASPTSNGAWRYRMTVEGGRDAPVWRQARREVFDPNTGAVHAID